jgi:hypothetical protein
MTNSGRPAYWNENAQRWCDEDGKFIQYNCSECGEVMREEDRGYIADGMLLGGDGDRCELCVTYDPNDFCHPYNVERYRNDNDEADRIAPPVSAFMKFRYAVLEAEAAATRLALAREEFETAVEQGVDPDATILPSEFEQLTVDIDGAVGMLTKVTNAVDQARFLMPRSANVNHIPVNDCDDDIPF